MNKLFFSVSVVSVVFFLGAFFVAPVDAANYPTTDNPAVMHVQSGFGFGPGIARNKVIDGAGAAAKAAGGSAADIQAAREQATNAIDVQKSLQIEGDGGQEPVLDFPKGNPVATGEEAITAKLAEFAAAKKAEDEAKKKVLQDECIFMQGGNVENQFIPPAGVKTAGSATGFGKYNPANPLDPATNSQENILLTDKKIGTYQQRWDEVSKQAQSDDAKNKGKTTTIYLPNAGQSVDGALLGEYNVNGVNVKTGKHYTVGSKGTDGVTVDKDCNPTKGEVPKDPFAGLGGKPGPGAGNGGGGGLGGGLGGLGGLGQMLPLLLASMLGGGLGGGQGGQGNQGTGSGNGLTNTQTSCSQYGVSPVCGSDGTTYNNSCWLQQYSQVQVSTGVCPTASASPSPTPDVGKIIAQLVAAGVPQSVIDDIIKSLNYTIPHTNTDSVVVQ